MPVNVLASIYHGLRLAHAYNNQIMYGVLLSAIGALQSFFNTYKASSSVKFAFYNGLNQVGLGSWQFVPLTIKPAKKAQRLRITGMRLIRRKG